MTPTPSYGEPDNIKDELPTTGPIRSLPPEPPPPIVIPLPAPPVG